MRTMQILLAGVLSVAFLTACNGQQDKKVEQAKQDVKEAEEKLDEARAKAKVEYEAYKADVNERIAENDRRIASLREDMKNSKKEVKKEYRDQVDKLEVKNNELKKEIGEFENTSDEKWQAFKREFNRDMDELGKAFENLGKDNAK